MYNINTVSLIHIVIMKCYFVQSNRLIKIENLDGLVNLEQLYLSHNGIEAIEGLDKLVSILPLLIAVIILRIRR